MRLRIFWVIIAIFFSILTLRLWALQIIHGNEYFVFSEENRIKLIPTDAPRGIIYDRNLTPLVINRPSFNVFIIPEEIIKHPQSINSIAKILNINSKRIWIKVKKNKRLGFLPVKIAKDISKKQVAVIEEHSIYLKGVYISADAKRKYVYNDFASHLLGYVGEINRGELNRLKIYGYKIKDTIGKDGVEQSYDKYLQGERGGRQIEISASGRHEQILSKKDPVKGNDIVLSLDVNMQKAVEDVFSKEHGAVIIMDPNTGEIRALTSKPSFDPNIFVDFRLQKKLIKTLKDNRRRPIVNRAIKSAYPPGSIFKLIVGLAGLERNIVSKNTWIKCIGWLRIGRIFHCWREDGHDMQNIVEAIKNSCNVYFYSIGRKLGINKIEKQASLFGFGKKTGILIKGERRGLLPSRDWKWKKYREKWYPGDTANFSIGQGFLLTTPLQMVTALSAIVNNGKLYQPIMVKKIIDNEDQEFRPFHLDAKKLKVKKENFKLIKKGMFKAVNDPYGTGRLAKLKKVKVSGKTGTVQVASKEKVNVNPEDIPWKLRNHAWFVCFAPFKNPEIAMVVFVEHGGSGGRKAAVVAKDILEKIYEGEK